MGRIDFNNYYITDYFKKIDRRRIRAGRSNLLPIKNIESDKVVDLNGTEKLRKEFQGYLALTLNLILQMISSSFFIALDHLYYELLDIVARHSRVNYEQEGEHYLNVTVDGKGLISNLIRTSIDGFNINKRIEMSMTNESCLPHPHRLKSFIIMEIYLLFLLNLYLIYNQVYIFRFRRFICVYFYPKREKKRVLYLYNKMLKRRKHIFNAMLEALKYKMKQHGAKQNTNIFQVIFFLLFVKRTLIYIADIVRCNFKFAKKKNRM